MNSPLRKASEGQADALGTLLKYREGGSTVGFAILELRAVLLDGDPDGTPESDLSLHYCVRMIELATGRMLGDHQTCCIRTITETYHHEQEIAEQLCEEARVNFLHSIPGSWLDEDWKVP